MQADENDIESARTHVRPEHCQCQRIKVFVQKPDLQIEQKFGIPFARRGLLYGLIVSIALLLVGLIDEAYGSSGHHNSLLSDSSMNQAFFQAKDALLWQNAQQGYNMAKEGAVGTVAKIAKVANKAKGIEEKAQVIVNGAAKSFISGWYRRQRLLKRNDSLNLIK